MMQYIPERRKENRVGQIERSSRATQLGDALGRQHAKCAASTGHVGYEAAAKTAQASTCLSC